MHACFGTVTMTQLRDDLMYKQKKKKKREREG